jgi:hypothetical protein
VLRLDHQGHDSSKGALGSSGKRDDVDVAWVMKRTGNDITLTRDKARGLGHPQKVMLRVQAAPARHLPLAAQSKQTECIEALNRLNIPTDATRDDAANLPRANNYKFRNKLLVLR